MLRFICHLLGRPYEPIEIEVFKSQIHLLQEQNQELLHTIIDLTKPEVRPVMTEIPQEVKPKHVPWSVTKRALEKRDRELAAEMLRRNNPEIVKEIEKLEEELGVNDASNQS